MIQTNTIRQQETNTIRQRNSIKIKSLFTNQDVISLLQSQINQLQQFGSLFIYSLTAEHLHLFLYFHRIRINQQDKNDVQGQYAIKITKGFPITGLRVHIMNNNCIPRLLDCRDVSEQILGSPWSFKNRLRDFFTKIDDFQAKLKIRNILYLPMQKTGQFRIGDLFGMHGLKKFKALQIFQDLTNPTSPILCIAQTHLLTFKQVPQSPQEKDKQKLFQLYRFCELQCISEVFHKKKQGEIIISFNVYNSKGAAFGQVKKLSKKYRLKNTQNFLGSMLKNITNFQKMQINLQINKEIANGQKVAKRLQESKQLQQKYHEMHDVQKKVKIRLQLVEFYRTLIQQFTDRKSSYYLIFIAKLNQLSVFQS